MVAAHALARQAELSLQQHLDLLPGIDHPYADPSEFAEKDGDNSQNPLTMAAPPVPHQSTVDKRRVKVYELRNGDWHDCGTGFCSADVHVDQDGRRDSRIYVESEESPDRLLLDVSVKKDKGWHRQQGTFCTETLIVWNEPPRLEMALSFQEVDGCAAIWSFIENLTNNMPASSQGSGDDSMSDDLVMDVRSHAVTLPPANLGNLPEIEAQIRVMSGSGAGRDILTKTIISESYITKLIPLVEQAEDLESLSDLHRLCNITKMIILLNDTSIIEHTVSDECVIGVVGALEYDPDFPSHKANHRQWLRDSSRYKEVVRIEDRQILRKVHQTYRLQYLKDVVLARILDDSTFSVLNSLIFFNQVDIVQHLQANTTFLSELFDIFKTQGQDPRRKKEAVLFIQQCCAIAKNLQPPARQTLYNNFIVHGLLQVINFGLAHHDVAVRVGATDVLVSMIDHDPHMIRHTIYRQISEHQQPLTDSLIDLLLVEVDLGVKSQISDALKVLLDQGPPAQPEVFAKTNDIPRPIRIGQAEMQHEQFLNMFYDQSAPRLFKPLLELKSRRNMNFTVQQASMFTYLVEILCFFVRQHGTKCRFFIISEEMVPRVVQLLGCPQVFLKLVAIRFLRQLIAFPSEEYVSHVAQKSVLGPVLGLVQTNLPRDNLLCSACLDFFEHIKRETIKPLIIHLVENYREQIQNILALEDEAGLELFRLFVIRYEQTRAFTANVDFFMSDDEDPRRRSIPHSRNGIGVPDAMAIDQMEEEYWNTSDDDDDAPMKPSAEPPSANGTPPSTKLVDYGSDEEVDENTNPQALINEKLNGGDSPVVRSNRPVVSPPEKLSEKRRREEDEEDDLGKLVQSKRRNSMSVGSNSPVTPTSLKKKKSMANTRDAGGGPKKIAISISPSVRAVGGRQDDES